MHRPRTPDRRTAHLSTEDPTKEIIVKLTSHNLIRVAGLSAVLAGVCYVGVGLFHPANVPSSVTTTRWAAAHVLMCATCFFGLLGMAGLYARQAVKAGWLGLVGFVMVSSWLVLVMGFSFVEAFVLPQAGTVTPAFVEGWMGMFNGTPSTVNLGALPTLWTLTAPLYILGGLSFGIATFRARILPRGAALLLAAGTAVAPVAGLLSLEAMPKIAIPVGLALAWFGCALFTERRTSPAQLAEHALAATARTAR
jgi:hypothetical protein